MKILCVIDNLGSGGAQRQMVELAAGLCGRGHDVEMFLYQPEFTFFRSKLEDHQIQIHEYNKGKGFDPRVVTRLRSLKRQNGYEIIVSFLNNPNIYSELSQIIGPKSTVVVSERSSHLYDRSRIGAFIRRNLHRFADHLVVNSHNHRRWLKEHCPWVADKVTTIYNGIDTELYKPDESIKFCGPTKGLRLVAVGRIIPGKNIHTLIEALKIFKDTYGWLPEITWAGRIDSAEYRDKVEQLLKSNHDVSRCWRWEGESDRIPELLAENDALILPSFFEGLPNVVCEALSVGRPVLASNVCDHPVLVSEGKRGFLFDPHDPRSIANAIYRLISMSFQEWEEMSARCRHYAEEELSVTRMVKEYENLFSELVMAG